MGQKLTLKPCKKDPDLFFSDDPKDEQRAKALCKSCVLQKACLTVAIIRDEPYGIWGGMNGKERSRFRRGFPKGLMDSTTAFNALSKNM